MNHRSCHHNPSSLMIIALLNLPTTDIWACPVFVDTINVAVFLQTQPDIVSIGQMEIAYPIKISLIT
jgi:hypothetical protein